VSVTFSTVMPLTRELIRRADEQARADWAILGPMTDTREDLKARVEHDLTLHPPGEPYVNEAMDCLRAAAKAFALEVVDRAPTCREQSLALTKIEEALFFAIAGVARNQGTLAP